jgi:trimeric autotransporter adhesin
LVLFAVKELGELIVTKLSQKLIKSNTGAIALRRVLMGGSAAVAMGAAFAPTSASAAVCAGSNGGTSALVIWN